MPQAAAHESSPGKTAREIADERLAPARIPLLHRGVTWMLLAQFLFAMMSVFTRVGANSVPWPEIAASRFVVGALLAWGFAVSRNRSLRIVNHKVAWTRSVFGTLSAVTVFYVLSNARIPLGDAVTIHSTGPIYVALLSWPILKERVEPRVAWAIPFAFLGMALVVKPTFQVAIDLALVAAAGAVAYSVAMVSLRMLGPGETREAIVLHFSIFASVVFCVASALTWETPSAEAAAYLLLTGLTGGLGQLAMTTAYSLERAAKISSLSYIGVIMVHLLAIPVFGELPGAWQIVGTLLVVGAGAMATLKLGFEQQARSG
ncbi:DMT family transporter [bacterium]|nr:DMT family transporter [bacterium]